MEAQGEEENRFMRRDIIDWDKIAVVKFQRYKVGLISFPWTFPFLIQAFYIQIKHYSQASFPKVLYLPQLYSSCLPAPATAALASATPALAPAARYVIACSLRVS